MRPINILLTFVCLNATLAGAMGGRPSVRPQSFGLSQGAVRFYYQMTQYPGPAETKVEFSYSLPYDQVQFVAVGQQFKAAYVFSVVAMDLRGNQVAGDSWERTLTVEKYQELQKGNYLVCDTFSLKLLPGRYRFRITCTDNNSERRGETEILSEISGAAEEKLAVSGLRFQKVAGKEVIPWPKRQYGDGNGDINFSFQIYAPGREALSLNWDLVRFGSVTPVWSQAETLAGTVNRADITKSIKVDSLLTGSYLLKVKVQGPEQSVILGESLFVRNSRLITVKDYREQIDQLAYISRGRELDSLRQASPALRETLLTRFWLLRDPDTTTSVNEFRDEYYDRVNYAEEHFGSVFKPGWKTDMGMVYMLYGLADEIERHPFEMDYPSYEIWYYYSTGSRFVFMDRKGIGDYELIYPKKEKLKWMQ